MTKCFEVSMKRSTLSNNTRSIYNTEHQISFMCPNHNLFDNIKIGDFIGVDDNHNIIKVISKYRFPESEEMSTSGVKASIEFDSRNSWGPIME